MKFCTFNQMRSGLKISASKSALHIPPNVISHFKKNMKVTLTLIVLMFINQLLLADEWIKEYRKVYTSQNGIYELVIEPTHIPENYENEILKRKKHPEKYLNSPMKDTIVQCHAKLYKKTGHLGLPELIWKKDLVNPVAPYEAMITNDGKYVITFDDWYNVGYGENVMVVYGENGEILKKYGLNEITHLNKNQLSVSVTSIWWYFGHETYSEKPEKVKILIIDKNSEIEERIYNLDKLEFEN